MRNGNVCTSAIPSFMRISYRLGFELIFRIIVNNLPVYIRSYVYRFPGIYIICLFRIRMPFPKPVWKPSLIVILKKLGCCKFVLHSCLLENVCDANEICNVYIYLLHNLLSATGSSPDEVLLTVVDSS